MGLKAVANVSVGGGTITGGGTPGKLAKFSTATSLGDSLLSESGTTITSAATAETFSSAQTWTVGAPNSQALVVLSNAGLERTLVLDTISRAVGVGVPTSPATLLHVSDGVTAFAGTTSNGVRLDRASEALFSSSDGTRSFRSGITASTAVVGTSTAHDLLLQRGNVTALTLGASGAVTFAGNLTSSAAQTWTLASSTSALNIQSGLLNLDTTNSRVGIGTTAPAKKLTVESNQPIRLGTSAEYWDFVQNNTNVWGWLSNASVYSMVWNNSTGNVGIGTLTPVSKLDVNGAANVAGALTVAGPVSRTSGSTAGVANGAFIVVTVPATYKSLLLSSTTTSNETLSSLHLIGSDATNCQVAAISVFQTTVTNNGVAASVRITNASGGTATIKWSFLQIS